jgi:hypothetical protein
VSVLSGWQTRDVSSIPVFVLDKDPTIGFWVRACTTCTISSIQKMNTSLGRLSKGGMSAGDSLPPGLLPVDCEETPRSLITSYVNVCFQNFWLLTHRQKLVNAWSLVDLYSVSMAGSFHLRQPLASMQLIGFEVHAINRKVHAIDRKFETSNDNVTKIMQSYYYILCTAAWLWSLNKTQNFNAFLNFYFDSALRHFCNEGLLRGVVM